MAQVKHTGEVHRDHILDVRGSAQAALTVPNAERMDLESCKSVDEVRAILSKAVSMLTMHVSDR